MNKRTKQTLLLFVCAVATFSCVATSGMDKWDEFLATQNSKTFEQVSKAIDKCKSVNCAHTYAAPNSGQLNKLLILDQNQNMLAIEISIKVLHILDGGNYEDTAITLGDVLEKNPQSLLGIIDKYKLDGSEYKDILCMLSPDVTDSDYGAINAIQKRINILSGIQNPSLSTSKNKAIGVLNKCLVNYQESQ
jgi:hypothetical protein